MPDYSKDPEGKVTSFLSHIRRANPRTPETEANLILRRPFNYTSGALKNGQIDAAFIVAGAPTTAVTDLATTKDTYLVSLDSEHIAKLLETSDYYTETVIAKDVYFGD